MATPIFEEVHSKQVMNKVQVSQMPFNWSINPYRGCAHGCSFCYARNTHTFLGLTADDTFQKHILVKANANEVLKQQLAKLTKRHGGNLSALGRELGLVAIGTATDPYQPVEARAKITRACLEVLAEYEVPITITTRSPLILRDLDILTNMNVKSINISVSTLDKSMWRNLEPSSPAPQRRLEAVRRLTQHNLPTGVFLAPIVPLLTDQQEPLENLLRAVKEHKAKFVMAAILRLAPEVKPWFFSVVEQHYPKLAARLKTLYSSRALPESSYTDTLMHRIHTIMAAYSLSRYHESLQRNPVRSCTTTALSSSEESQVQEGIQLRLPI